MYINANLTAYIHNLTKNITATTNQQVKLNGLAQKWTKFTTTLGCFETFYKTECIVI